MSYIQQIVEPLSRMFEKFSTLNPHQLSGQAANLAFWLEEVEHALGVIDGYRKRFEKLKAAQVEHTQKKKTFQFDIEDRYDYGETIKPPRAGVSDTERKQLRRELTESFYRFAIRCCNNGFISRDELKDSLSQFGLSLDPDDLKK